MPTELEWKVRRAIEQSRASASGGYASPGSESISLPRGLEDLIAQRVSGHISEYEFNQKYWQLAGKKLKS